MTTAVLLAFATFLVTLAVRQTIEMFTGRAITTLTKNFVVVLVAGGLSIFLFPEATKENVIIGCAGGGGAMVVHRLHRLMGAAGDAYRLQVMQGDVRRHRP